MYGEGFEVRGANSNGDARMIFVYDNGKIRGYKNAEVLGIVGSQMEDNLHDIFAHFNVMLPEAFRQKRPR